MLCNINPSKIDIKHRKIGIFPYFFSSTKRRSKDREPIIRGHLRNNLVLLLTSMCENVELLDKPLRLMERKIKKSDLILSFRSYSFLKNYIAIKVPNKVFLELNDNLSLKDAYSMVEIKHIVPREELPSFKGIEKFLPLDERIRKFFSIMGNFNCNLEEIVKSGKLAKINNTIIPIDVLLYFGNLYKIDRIVNDYLAQFRLISGWNTPNGRAFRIFKYIPPQTDIQIPKYCSKFRYNTLDFKEVIDCMYNSYIKIPASAFKLVTTVIPEQSIRYMLEVINNSEKIGEIRLILLKEKNIRSYNYSILSTALDIPILTVKSNEHKDEVSVGINFYIGNTFDPNIFFAAGSAIFLTAKLLRGISDEVFVRDIVIDKDKIVMNASIPVTNRKGEIRSLVYNALKNYINHYLDNPSVSPLYELFIKGKSIYVLKKRESDFILVEYPPIKDRVINCCENRYHPLSIKKIDTPIGDLDGPIYNPFKILDSSKEKI